MLNNTDMLFQEIIWKSEKIPLLRKQECRKVQHLIECDELCHFYSSHNISFQNIKQ